jgi:hypothetical protein
MKVVPTPWIPKSAVAIIQDDDDNDDQTASVKGILRQPRALAGLTLRIELLASAQKVADITNILANISHENIAKIHAMGDHFVVIDFWDETLKSRLGRWGFEKGGDYNQTMTTRKRNCLTGIYSSRKSFNAKDRQLDLWQDVALPITRALLYLHQQHVALGGTLNMQSIVLSYGKGSTSRPPKVLLRDFSKAMHASTVSEYFSDVYALLSDDVFQLGQLFTELERFQPLESVDTRNEMVDLIGRCCNLNPMVRPSIVGVQARLLEILRYEEVFARGGSSPWNLNRLVCPIGRLSCPMNMTPLDLSYYDKGGVGVGQGGVWVPIRSYSDVGQEKVTGMPKPRVGRRYSPLKDDPSTSCRQQQQQQQQQQEILNLSIPTVSTSHVSFYRCECSSCRTGGATGEITLNPTKEELMNQLDALVHRVYYRTDTNIQ